MGAALLNACILFSAITGDKLSIVTLRNEVAMSLLIFPQDNGNKSTFILTPNIISNLLEDLATSNRSLL